MNRLTAELTKLIAIKFSRVLLSLVLIASARSGLAQVNPSANQPANAQDAAQIIVPDISEALAKETIIRVYISPAPGFGHQAATVTVMRRLRHLGFTGHFDVIYSDSVSNKLSTLLPGFDPNQTDWQELHHLKLRAIALSQFQNQRDTQRVALGVTGAEDERGSMTPERLNVDSYLRLQPLGWGSSALITREAPREQTLPGLNGLGFTFEIADDAAALTEHIENMRRIPELESKTEGVRSIL